MILGTRKRKKIILKLVIVSAVLYIIFLFINQFIRIKDKKEEIQKIQEEILTEKSKNEQFLDMLDAKTYENNGQESASNEDGTSHGSVRVFESVTR